MEEQDAAAFSFAVRPADEVFGVISQSICADAVCSQSGEFLSTRISRGAVIGLSAMFVPLLGPTGRRSWQRLRVGSIRLLGVFPYAVSQLAESTIQEMLTLKERQYRSPALLRLAAGAF